MYKLIGENNIFADPVRQVLENRGLLPEEIEWFIKPSPYEYSSSELKNIDEAAKLLLHHIEMGNNIHVQIDKDLDGIVSASVLINYLELANMETNITWSNHSQNKKHGIDIDLIPPKTDLLVVPDASSNEYEIHREVSEMGIDILVLDHHEAAHYSPHAVVVNNQLDNYPNKQLSGVGVVYKFIQHMDKKLELDLHENFTDLVAFGLIGDGMQIKSKETYWLIKKGLSNIKNEMLKELIKENVDYGIKLTPTIVAFKINPKINSLLRVGSQEELDDIVKAFLGHQEITYNNRLRREDKSETWTRRMTRICNNTYARQRRMRDSLMEQLEEQIEGEGLHRNKFIVVEVGDDFELNMSGYVAAFLVNRFSKPCLVLREVDGGILVGSMRGYEPFMSHTKDFLNSLNTFILAEGHQNACGLQITRENMKTLNEKINSALESFSAQSSKQVDFSLNSEVVDEGFINRMDKYSHLWGQGLDEPAYVVKDVEVSASNIQIIGKDKNVAKFSIKGVEYVQFSADSKLLEMVGESKILVLDIVGKTGINSWLGRVTPQFVIDTLVIKDVKEEGFGGFVF